MDHLQNITSDKVKDFYKLMANKYNAKFINKKDSRMMKGVGLFLDTITVMDNEVFLKNYTTTFWGNIYFCYEIGEGNLENQIGTLIHELHHVLQFNKDPISMPIEYLLYNDCRALYEAEAWSANIEFKYLRYGFVTPTIFNTYAHKFKNYNGTTDDILMIESKLKSDYIMMQQKIAVSQVVQDAIKILTQQGCWI